MDTLGAQLKHAREMRGLSLQEIADKTKISATALEAVERNDFSRLPGGIFGRSFIRAYALAVGVDPDATVATFVEALEESEREAAARGAVRPEITPDDQRFLDRQRRAVMWLRVGIAMFVLLVLSVAVWQLRGRFGGAVPETASPSTPAASAPAAPDPSTVSAPVVGPAVVPPTTPVVSEPLAPIGSTPAPVSSETSSVPQSSPTPQPSSGGGAPVVVELTLTADCWIAVAADGGAPRSQLYRVGDRPRFEGTRELRLDIGNAGAVAMTVNGRPARPLGNSGSTARLRITPENAGEWSR